MLTRRAAWPRAIGWLIGGIAAVVVMLAVGWALFVPAADWLAHHDVGAAKGAPLQATRDAARGRLLTLGAGLLAAGALVFTARNFTLSRRTFQLTEQGQVTDRYTKAIEQLGSGQLDVRIGGVYALERVGRDSPRDHPTVMEVLAAFIREHSREQWPAAEFADAPVPDRTTRPDVQAALTVIGRRDPKRDIRPIDLSLSNLTRANLADAILVGTNLTRADLTGADLSGAKVGRANLSKANLTYANLGLADLTGATFGSATLGGANLFHAELGEAILLDADLTDANLANALLTNADLTGANLTIAALADANLTGANLTGAQLRRANLTNANLTGADLSDVDLPDANLAGANLTDANLTGAWFPAGAVPEGWACPPGSGRLVRAVEGPGDNAPGTT